MKTKRTQPLITTIKDRCKRCYTCVRECPSKAIRIADGQAQVIAERCIGCGNCVRVCTQGAKTVIDSVEAVRNLLQENEKITACLAPSFPAEFIEYDYQTLIGMIKELGFSHVHEVAFGADLVARRMRELLNETDESYISSSCPAAFGFIKRYHPDLVNRIAPVVSPMIAMARAIRTLYGDDMKMVFIGPCIAKKGEAYSDEIDGEVDEVLTFRELRRMILDRRLSPKSVMPSDFDPPHSAKGGLFPIQRGMLESADIHEDLLSGEVVSANGKTNFSAAISEFESGDLKARLLDVLSCDGCIMGAGMSTQAPLYKRHTRVTNFVRDIWPKRDAGEWRITMGKLRDLDLSRTFAPDDQRLSPPHEDALQKILERMGKFTPEDELNCGSCGYDTCRDHAIAIHKGLAEVEMCLPYTIERLHQTIMELNSSNNQLADAKEALIQSEKMASMGQLAAGIAHEVNNPLGVVLMYSHLLMDELADNNAMHEDLKMIADHADRAKKIVAGLLHFARQNKVVLKPVNVPEMIEKVVRHLRLNENVTIELNNELSQPVAELDEDQMIQVFTNLVNNAMTAMANGGRILIRMENTDSHIKIHVSDTGVGIPKPILAKIFEPFFTTKEVGQGTGLGLAIAYGIVKMHRGDIQVVSNTDTAAGPTGSTFTVVVPIKGQQ